MAAGALGRAKNCGRDDPLKCLYIYIFLRIFSFDYSDKCRCILFIFLASEKIGRVLISCTKRNHIGSTGLHPGYPRLNFILSRIYQLHNHAQYLKVKCLWQATGQSTWHTNVWPQQKLPKFGFRTHTTALWPASRTVFNSGYQVRLSSDSPEFFTF